ncbi:MAG: type II toxin-antitoxin system VapC family toxin [Verrucomicrobiales bacterium]|nr:type II toxin-antitoxin system VapC family toxin [Verrucomicrobiales bacterium]
MEIVYVETTVVSLLVANPSQDLLVAVQQQATRDWWRLRRPAFLCITSDETRREAARGDAEQVRLRLAALAGMPVLAITPEVENLAAEFLRTRALPPVARSDAIHLAAATTARADYLLTWNCRHLANAQILRRLEREAARFEWPLPTVCTPLELMGESTYETESSS